MGLMLSIVSRFRKRATTREVLEGIEEDTKKLQTTLQRNQKLQKRIVLSLLTFSILSYVVAVAIVYFFLLPDNWSDRAIWFLPFVCFPALVHLLKKSFHFFFVTRIRKIGKEIEDLNKRKKDILEDVTENETYKVAKELLEKFDPFGKIIERDFAVKQSEVLQRSPSQGELRHRGNAAKPNNGVVQKVGPQPALSPRSPMQGPIRPNLNPSIAGPNMTPRTPQPYGNGYPRQTPGPSTPRSRYPITPMERSIFDKVAEYFVGDGPSYRYALICKTCHGHNGMALMDEFEYIAFRCCYCGSPNPARKSRPNAPPLDDSKLSDRESDKEKKTGSENASANEESDVDHSKYEDSKDEQNGEVKENTDNEKSDDDAVKDDDTEKTESQTSKVDNESE
eukprot:Seg2133.6 transcript_id=Seg2133.6/GoldUCD/mRNA.D3Y31 product="Endoplasmic reticulum junction formation protein lunapark-B" protein_id=Seg2133.6/GoldUCD/D3Y31